jgi:D-alanyl-D-alanine carboxypeptidase
MPTRPAPQKQSKKNKPKLPLKFAASLFLLLVLFFIIVPRLNSTNSVSKNQQNGFNKNQYSINDPASIWAVVNKGRALPASYIPQDLLAPNVPLRLPATDPEMQIRSVAAPLLQQMFSEALKQNVHLMLSSGYRSYALQSSVYSGYVNSQGQKSADSSSAKPGHSEHQTGLAIDIEPTSRDCEVELCFANTPEGKWLNANAYKYGFIIRYQKGQDKLSGYEYEPWHVRFVGKELAAQIHTSNQTLEQFFGQPSYTEYKSNPYQLASGN